MISGLQNRRVSYKALSTLRIVAIYAVLSGLWIYYSDTILGSIVKDPDIITKISIIKGWLFIIVTGSILFYLISRFAAEIQTTQQELAVSEGYYRGIFDHADDAIYIADPRTLKILNCNYKACSMLGFSMAELISRTVFDLHPPEEHRRLARKIGEIHPGTPSASIFGLHHSAYDGRLIPVEVSISFIKISDEEVYICIFRDVTGKALAQEEARKSYALLNAVISGTSDATYVKDLLGRYLLFNPAAEGLTGKRAADVLGKDSTFIFGPAEAAVVMENDRKIIEGGKVKTFEEIVTGASGETRTFLATKGPLFDAEGKPYGLFGVSRDITERKRAEEERARAEEQMQQAQRLESLGVLAGGIAHDFNNLLMSILGHSSLAQTRLPHGSQVMDDLQQIEAAAQRAADLCSQMLAYAGKGQFSLEAVDLGCLIEEMARLLKVSISKKSLLKLDLLKDLPLIDADPAQIRQIVMNLIINASEAIGEQSGVITVSTGITTCDPESPCEAYIGNDTPEGEFVFLQISDTGCGMDRDTQQRIFEPFFTTKFTGRGLGLSAVLGIIRAHKGACRLHSELGKGTTFKALFPVRLSADSLEHEQFAPALPELEGTGTVLLVDDEHIVLDACRALLEAIGYSVLTALNGHDALVIYREHGRDIDLVILDLTMPHMDGAETYDELIKCDPEARIIIASGYAEQDVTTRFAGKGLAGFIHKPYSLAQLRDVLKKAKHTLK